MKKIYILLMHTNTFPSKFIKVFTQYKYSHVGISLNKSCDNIYSFGRRKVNSILDGGFTIENRNGAFFRKFNKTICKIFEVKVTNKQYKTLEAILSNMKENMNDYEYDYLGIVPRFLGIPFKRNNKYVCSYFVAELLNKSGIYDFKKETCMITPKDFDNIDGLKEIYTGYYKEYNSDTVIDKIKVLVNIK